MLTWRKVLTNLGEKMTDEEVDELLKAVDTSSGEINYTGMSALPACMEAATNFSRLQSSSAPFSRTKSSEYYSTMRRFVSFSFCTHTIPTFSTTYPPLDRRMHALIFS